MTIRTVSTRARRAAALAAVLSLLIGAVPAHAATAVDIEVRALTRAILAIAKSLRLRTVGEGVERPTQLEVLRAHGCTAAQGYIWSAPLPAASFMALLSARSRVGPGANTA